MTTGLPYCSSMMYPTWGSAMPRWTPLPTGIAPALDGGLSRVSTPNCGNFPPPTAPLPVPPTATGAMTPSLAALLHSIQSTAVAKSAPEVATEVGGADATSQARLVAVVDDVVNYQHGGERVAASRVKLFAPEAAVAHATRAPSPSHARAAVQDDDAGVGGDGGERRVAVARPPPDGGVGVSASRHDFILDYSQRPRIHKRTSISSSGTPQYKCHYCDYVSDRCVRAPCGVVVHVWLAAVGDGSRVPTPVHLDFKWGGGSWGVAGGCGCSMAVVPGVDAPC